MLETKRLILRPFRESDAEDVYEYRKEPMVNCFDCMRLNSPEQARAEIAKRSDEGEFWLAIVLKENGKVIGEIEAHPESSQPDCAERACLWSLYPLSRTRTERRIMKTRYSTPF